MKSTKIRRIGNAVAVAATAAAMWAYAARADQQVDALVAWDGKPVAMEVDPGMTTGDFVRCLENEAAERGYPFPTSATFAFGVVR